MPVAERKRLTVARKHAAETPPKPGDPIHVWLAWVVAKRRRNLQDSEIAERAGMSVTRFSQILNGHAGDIRFSAVARILRAVGAKFGDLDKP